jgi:histidinol-phosphatase (PHP family)
MPNYNLHQHSNYSDGKDELGKYVQKAIELNFSAIGFTEHSPLPFNNPFSLKQEKVNDYVNEIDLLREKYLHQIIIHRGLEMDFIAKTSEDFDYWAKKCKTDYLIGSVHLVSTKDPETLWFTDGPDPKIYDDGIQKYFEGDVKKAVKAFFHQNNQMIESQKFDIIGHFDKIKMHNGERFFNDEDKWYRNLLEETLELIKSKNLIVEINTRGIYKKRCNKLFPDDYALKRVKELKLPIIISSDAHQPSEINALFDVTVDYLKQLGFNEMMNFINSKWEYVEIK